MASDDEIDDKPRWERRLEERAIRDGWQVPDELRVAILARLGRTIDDVTADERYVLMAARTIVTADLKQQAIDLQKRLAEAKLGGGETQVKDLVGEAEARAKARLAERDTAT